MSSFQQIVKPVYVTGGVAIAAGVADKTAFIYGTSIENPSGGVYQDTLPTVSAGTTGAFRITAYRGLHVNLRDSSGNELLGQKLMAASIPVAIASDQSHFPIELQDGSGNAITSTGSALDVNLKTSSITVTVTGTVAATQSGTWDITNISGTISLPTGAATAANQTSVIGTLAAGTSATNSLLMGGVYNTALPTLTTGQQVALQLDSSGRQILAPLTNASIVKAQLQDNAGTAIGLGQTTMSASVPVAIASNQSTLTVKQNTSATSSVTSVGSSATNVQLLASTAGRLGATFFNDSTQVLYLKLGTTASSTSYTVQLPAGGYYELPYTYVYTGEIDGIWASANGNVRITELT